MSCFQPPLRAFGFAGLSTKVKQAAVLELSKLVPEPLRPLPLSLIRINDSRTDITPSAGGTFASTTSEGSCAAITDACKKLIETLKPASEKVKDAKTAEEFWKGVIEQVYQPRMVGIAGSTVPLSARGHFNGKETEGTPIFKQT